MNLDWQTKEEEYGSLQYLKGEHKSKKKHFLGFNMVYSNSHLG